MPYALLLLLCAPLLLLEVVGCEQKKTTAELNLEKQKAWQAQQKGRAAKFYQELITKYPESPFVPEAKQRLQAMGPIAGTPKPGGKPAGQ